MKKQQVGIWIDTQEAYIIRVNGKDAEVATITSDIDTGEIKGGSGTGGTPWGPQINVSENKGLERRKHEQKQYFEEIKEAIKTVDEVYIFGPAEMKIHLEKALIEDKSFKPDILAVETADSMTHNQRIAKVKDFFTTVGNRN
jgi:hypothetical protein